MQSASRTALGSPARSSTDSSPQAVGPHSEVSESEMRLSFRPKFLRLKKAIDGRRRILDEASFVQIFLREQLPQREAMEKFSVPRHVLVASNKVYGPKYRTELRELRSKNHTSAMMGNTHGAGLKADLDEKMIRALVRRGFSDWQIAQELGSHEGTIKRHLKKWRVVRRIKLPRSMHDLESTELSWLEGLVPGVRESVETLYEKPHEFFLKLYEAQGRLFLLLEDLRQIREKHRYFVERGLIPRDHVSWGLNRHELLLSLELLRAGVPHVREFCFFKNWRADFSFPGTKLLVEVDGEFYMKNPVTIARDQKRGKKARELGYRVIRFSTTQVDRNLSGVVRRIVRRLHESPRSTLSVCVGSGTSKSKKTTATKPKAS